MRNRIDWLNAGASVAMGITVAIMLTCMFALGWIVVVSNRPDPIPKDGVFYFEHRNQNGFTCTSAGAFYDGFPVGPCIIVEDEK